VIKVSLIFFRYVAVVIIALVFLAIFFVKKPDIPLYSSKSARKLSYVNDRNGWYKGSALVVLCVLIVVAMSVDGALRVYGH
jgi:hypothetical protein